MQERDRTGEAPKSEGSTQEDNKAKASIIRSTLLGSVILAGTLGGGVGSYTLTKNDQESAIQDKRDQAAKNIRCIKMQQTDPAVRIESGRAIVNLSDMSDQERADCGMENLEAQLAPREGTFAPNPYEAEIASSVDVKLPSADRLQASAHENLQEAEDGIGTMDVAFIGVSSALGATFGFFGSVFGSAAVAIGGARIRQRMQS